MTISFLDLNGPWQIAYTAVAAALPGEKDYSSTLNVPGCWDDSPDAFAGKDLKTNEDYQAVDFSQPGELMPDSSLPFITGTVWYRREIMVPATLVAEGFAVLKIGRVSLDARVFLNGELMAVLTGHSTAHEAVLPAAKFRADGNELVIAVSNSRRDRLGCVIRGFKGFSGGIFGDVSLAFYAGTRVRDCYLCPSEDLQNIHWQLELEGQGACEMCCALLDDSQVVMSKEFTVGSDKLIRWDADACGLTPWSDTNPKLYRVRVELRHNGEVLDRHEQNFGLRRLVAKGKNLELNGRPIFLRGNTEHAYFAETCTPPLEPSYYERIVGKFKEIGFNWLRFHTWVPFEAYLDACDRAGMLIQVEPPLGFEEGEWRDILRACRRHPSVVIYCGGNEELLDEKKIAYLKHCRNILREQVPDGLFNPQEALRGVEYCWNQADFGAVLETAPFPHNPERLAELESFSDVLAHYDWGHMSYNSAYCPMDKLRKWQSVYHRPCLSHEITIHGAYLDLSLRERYKGTRIGYRLFDPAIEALERAGMLDKAGLFYRNSCHWQRILRKHCVENARLCGGLAGYDLLGGIDYQWHRHGYPCGIMNEFYELKSETPDDVLRYNGPNVLLSSLSQRRTWNHGDQLNIEFFLSCFEPERIDGQMLKARISDLASGETVASQDFEVRSITLGVPVKLAAWQVNLPSTGGARSYKVTVELGSLANNWTIWSFPVETAVSAGPLVCTELDSAILEQLSNGASVVLLGAGPFPVAPTSFQISCAGRSNGNLATVVKHHSALGDFPHEGWCDWQFFELLTNGHSVVFNDLDIPFVPIVEVASSFKRIFKQSPLFELQVGQGRLLVCTLNLSADTPEVRYLRNRLLAYAAGAMPPELPQADAAVLRKLLESTEQKNIGMQTDEGFDVRGQLKK